MGTAGRDGGGGDGGLFGREGEMDPGFKEEAVIIQDLPFNQINQTVLCLHSLNEF